MRRQITVHQSELNATIEKLATEGYTAGPLTPRRAYPGEMVCIIYAKKLNEWNGFITYEAARLYKPAPFEAHAVCALSNFGGVAIELDDDNGTVRYKWYEEGASRPQKIKYTRTGEAYFTVCSNRYYLRDFMRV